MPGFALLALLIGLGPFTGPPLPGSVPGTAKFSVTLRGRPREAVRLRAVGVPAGYIASFCTDRVCAPFHVAFVLPRSGRQSIELQLIENNPGARAPKAVTVAAAGAGVTSFPFARATR